MRLIKSTNDARLNEAFARQVAHLGLIAKHKGLGGITHMTYCDEEASCRARVPDYVDDATAVLPYLHARKVVTANWVLSDTGVGHWRVDIAPSIAALEANQGVIGALDASFSRAAVIALLRANGVAVGDRP